MIKKLLTLCLLAVLSLAAKAGEPNAVPGPVYQTSLSAQFSSNFKDVSVVTITTPGQYVVNVTAVNYALPHVHFPRGGAHAISVNAVISGITILDSNNISVGSFSGSTTGHTYGVNQTERVSVYRARGRNEIDVSGIVNGMVVGNIARHGRLSLQIVGP
jgi:hypothetical protein